MVITFLYDGAQIERVKEELSLARHLDSDGHIVKVGLSLSNEPQRGVQTACEGLLYGASSDVLFSQTLPADVVTLTLETLKSLRVDLDAVFVGTFKMCAGSIFLSSIESHIEVLGAYQ